MICMIRIFLLFIVLFLCNPHSFAFLIKGKVEVVKGRAHIYRQGRILQLVDDMNIYTGDVIESSSNSSVLVEIMDMGLLKIKAKTQVTFPEGDDAQIQSSRLNLMYGELWLKIKKLVPGETFAVKTSNSVALVSNSIAVVTYQKRSRKATYSVIEGNIEVHIKENHYFLMSGEKLILDDRRNSMARHRKVDAYKLNQEWKKIITIREKLKRKVRESKHIPSKDGKVDSQIPLVHIVSPIEGVPHKKRRMRLRATIFEEHLDRLILTVNKKVVRDIQTNLKNFDYDILLNPGKNEIELKAIDQFGNVGRDIKTIQLLEHAPSISVFFPLDNQELDSRFIDLQGVVDDVDVKEVEIFVNGRPIARDRAIPTFHIPLILDIGQNVIRVEATNSVGLKGENEIIVWTSTKSKIIIEFERFFE
ncbi:MAG: hypothetical protein COB02_12530 [Candidatus Cloacimonadota bacterium]|nr:MAG: hypothetical protein COB02_12530 [Candidatus Cloacimonadota bacterium]